MDRRGDSAPRAGIQHARKKQILIFMIGKTVSHYRILEKLG
jgi:hypothetical protein